MKKIFTEQEELEVVRRYLAGETARELAEEFYCVPATVYAVTSKYGAWKRKPQTLKGNRQMIMNDWNADVSAEDMMRTYGFNSLGTLYGYVHRHRQEGYAFKVRRGHSRDVAAIMTDWNNGMTRDDIAVKHDFASKDAVTSFVVRQRREGYGFRRRYEL